MNGLFGDLGIGLGSVLALLALLSCWGPRGSFFRGDMFVAGAVVFCSALLLLFVALPVGKSLIGAFLAEDGSFSLAALACARGSGPGLPGWRAAAGVAWNTLFLWAAPRRPAPP